MSSWTKQMGFPVIQASLAFGEADSATLTLRQDRFIADGSQDDKKPLWKVSVLKYYNQIVVNIGCGIL